MKIFLNAGHGGTDPGACSKTGTKEADITAKVVEILAARLKLNWFPFECYQQQKSVYEVSKVENKSGATLFISIHCNSHTNENAHGVETWYCNGSTKGLQIADIVQKELVKATNLTNRGIKPSSTLHVLNKTKAPAVLVELAFISNPTEEQILKTKPEMFANAIWEAIKILKSKGLI
jgi:N-acetylmuramoyl-L-alanine amidase